MGRPISLTPHRDARSGSWILNVPATLNSDGKRKREFFSNRKDAETRADQLKAARSAGHRVAQAAGPDLIRAAANFDDLFRTLYGFQGGLAEACEAFIKHLDTANQSLSFEDIVTSYEQARSRNWSHKYARNWKWFRGVISPLFPVSTTVMTSDYWTKWLDSTARKESWKDRTYNDVASMLSSIWNAAVKQSKFERNPMDGVHRRKIRRESKPVYTADEVRALMNCTWEHDRELVPYFAIAIFAGLRPDEKSEITALGWDDVNLNEGWIRVAAKFDNKTETKRFVQIEPNLKLWLAPWEKASGMVVPKNLRTRRRWITRGKYQCPPGTPEEKWHQLVPFGADCRDITRHTFGSFLEAKYRDRNRVKEAMGHADFKTYEQHYRNARSPQEAEAFWSIVPPTN